MQLNMISPCLDFLLNGLCQRSAPILETSRSRLDMTAFRAKKKILRVILALTYYSDILAFDLTYILTFYLAFYLTFYLTFFLTFFSAFFLACFVAFCLAFSPACVRVQAWSAALGAGDMVFGSRQGPREARGEGRSEGVGRSCTFLKF